MKNANIAVADLLNLAGRTEDLRLKGEILMHVFNEARWEHCLRESKEKIDIMIDKVVMDLMREEVTLDMGYLDLYKVYRDCENDEAKSDTFAYYFNSAREEVTRELLYVMAERRATVLGEVITQEEFAEKSYNEYLSDADIRAEYDADFPEGKVNVDDYFWEVIGH